MICNGLFILYISRQIAEKDKEHAAEDDYDIFADDKEFFTENGFLQATEEIRCKVIKEDGYLGLEIARFSDNRRMGM